MGAPIVIEFTNLVAKASGNTVTVDAFSEKTRAFTASNAPCEAMIRTRSEVGDHASKLTALMFSMNAQ